MENSKLDPNKLENSNLVFYKSDRDFFRKGFFHLSILRKETPVLIDPGLTDYWSRNLEVKIQSISDILPPNNMETKEIFQGTNLKPLSRIGSYSLYFATSGSTGEPKLILKSDKEIGLEIKFLIPFLEKYISRIKAKPDFLVTIPLFHLYGFIWGFALALEMGSTTHDSESLSSMRRIITEFNPTIWITVPSILSSMMEIETFHRPDPIQSNANHFEPLIITSGSAMGDDTVAKLKKANYSTVLEIYGSTETGGIGFREPLKSPWIEKFSCHKLQEIDNCLAIGSEFIHPSIPLDENGFFRTEDIVELQGNKFLHKGRKDRIVKVHGKRIHLDLIEKEIRKMDGIDDVTAVAIQSSSDWEIAVLIQRTAAEIELDWNSIPKIFLPHRFKFIDQLPQLQNGKKDYASTKQFFS